MRESDRQRSRQLFSGLSSFVEAEMPLQGVADEAAAASLVRQMIDSLHRIEFVRHLDRRPIDSARLDPTSALFCPIRAAFLLARQGEHDEAAWLVFLATHFGPRPKRPQWEMTRRVYGALGTNPHWTWARVSNDLAGFRAWFTAHADELAGVPFGNHRKYESVKINAAANLADTVEGFVRWVGPNQGFRVLIEQAGLPDQDPYATFDALYEQMDVPRFGRTAKFDFLTMVSKVGLANIEPPHPYLIGATGPQRGAKLLVANDPTAPIEVAILSDVVVRLGRTLSVGMQVMEDALCNWQKSQFAYAPFRG